jgi:Zn-dependent M28 family amino/carboxypeptidase
MAGVAVERLQRGRTARGGIRLATHERPVGARRVAPLVAVVLAAVIAACSTAPQASRPASTGAPDTTGPGPSGPTSPRPSVGAEPALASALHDALDIDDITADLARLNDLSTKNGGARQAGSAAESAATTFIADELRAAGLDVELQPVDVPFFTQDAASILEIVGGSGAPLEDLHDFKAMLFSASGDVTAPIHALGFDPVAGSGASSGLGCNAADFAEVPAGSIVLVQPAQCRRHDVVVNAQEAGAVAIVTAYPGWARDAVLRPTLITPEDIRIPALGATHAAGIALAEAAAAGATVRVATDTMVETRTSANVIAETQGGDPAHVVMLGGHLDSVVDGPGINDNGSGTMAILEIAREAAAAAAAAGPSEAPWKVRVAFWTGEELGLWGSQAYVESLDTTETAAIEAYLNLDMIGSKNGLRMVYDASDGASPEEGAVVSDLFARAFERSGLVWQSTPIGASSDHFPFVLAGVTVGGLFSGANEVKSEAQAGLFGGVAGAPTDPCYHLACDTLENIDPKLVEDMARAAAWVTGALASGEVVLGTP